MATNNRTTQNDIRYLHPANWTQGFDYNIDEDLQSSIIGQMYERVPSRLPHQRRSRSTSFRYSSRSESNMADVFPEDSRSPMVIVNDLVCTCDVTPRNRLAVCPPMNIAEYHDVTRRGQFASPHINVQVEDDESWDQEVRSNTEERKVAEASEAAASSQKGENGAAE